MIPAARRTWLYDGHGGRLDPGIEWPLIARPAFMPCACGAVEAWSEEIVIVLPVALCMCFLLKNLAAGPLASLLEWDCTRRG